MRDFVTGIAYEINGRHCIGDQRILGLEPNLFPSDPQNVPRFWPLDHWGELAGSGVSLVVSEGIDPRFNLDPGGECCLSPRHGIAPRRDEAFLGTKSHIAAMVRSPWGSSRGCGGLLLRI